MTRSQKYLVELTLGAMRDAVDTMVEEVGHLHDRARLKQGLASEEARRYADQVSASAQEIRDVLMRLEAQVREIAGLPPPPA